MKFEQSPVGRGLRKIRDILIEPTRFFQGRDPVHEGLSTPLLFAIFLEWAVAIIVYARDFAVGLSEEKLIQALERSHSAFKQLHDINFGVLKLGLLLINPLQSVLGILFGSVLLHAGVMIFVPNRPEVTERRFSTTASVTAYARASAAWLVIPYIGWLIGLIWSGFTMIIGVRETYRTSTTRAVLVTLFPFLIWSLAITAVVLMILGVVLKASTLFAA